MWSSNSLKYMCYSLLLLALMGCGTQEYNEVIVYTSCDDSEVTADLLYSSGRIADTLRILGIEISYREQSDSCGYLLKTDKGKNAFYNYAMTDVDLLNKVLGHEE